MQDLRLIGVQEDGEHLLLAGPDGTHFRLALDEPLRAAARRDRPRLGQLQIEIDGGMRPREVQSLIRAGASAEEVADRAGWTVEKVGRYEGPILAERVHVADQARLVRVRSRGGATGSTVPTLQNGGLAKAQVFTRCFLAYFGQYPWYLPRAPEVEVSELGRDNAAKIANFEAAIPRPELQKRADEVLARTKANQAEKTDALELRLLSERLGTWLVSGDSNVRPSPREKPELLEQVLRLDDLGNLSRRDLRILRNTVYARKGRDFVSEGLREYFATKAWYQKDDGYSDKKLSAVDWKNIKLISSVEDTLGGPLSDGEHFGRTYGWFGGA